jgi:hypothetical protein
MPTAEGWFAGGRKAEVGKLTKEVENGAKVGDMEIIGLFT